METQPQLLLLSPPAAFQDQVVDMTHVYQEVEKKHGKKKAWEDKLACTHGTAPLLGRH